MAAANSDAFDFSADLTRRANDEEYDDEHSRQNSVFAEHGSSGLNVDFFLPQFGDADDATSAPIVSHNFIEGMQRVHQLHGNNSPPLAPIQPPTSAILSNASSVGFNEAERLFGPMTVPGVSPKDQLSLPDAARSKALLALQARSRHPEMADPATATESSLYGSLPMDIGSLECTVYVQYLPVTMKEIDFMNMICKYGNPKRVRICGNPKKEHNWTYGFVEYGTAAEATNFIQSCDGSRAGNYRMRCNIAKTPIVDRLAIDAPPDGKCTFAQKFPERTLRELILASIVPTGDDQQPNSNGGGALSGERHSSAGSPDAHNALSEPVLLNVSRDVCDILGTAVRDTRRYLTDHNQSNFFSARGIIQATLEQAKRRAGSNPQAFNVAAALNGTDVSFICRMMLTALHILHGSYEDALRFALSALQGLPTPVAIVAYLNAIDTRSDAATFPRGFTPLMLNQIMCFGLLVEPFSVVAARAFFHTAQHRAAMHGYPPNKVLDAQLATEIMPASRGGSSLLRTLLPLVVTQPGGFPGYFITSLVNNPNFDRSCVALFDHCGCPPPADASDTARSMW